MCVAMAGEKLEGERLTAFEAHTCGQPVRVVTDGVPPLRGATHAEKCEDFASAHDRLRSAVMLEPRGHSAMLGAYLTPPTTPGADFGLVFTTPEGYLPMCGDALIAAATVVLQQELIPVRGDDLAIDTASGVIQCRVERSGDRVTSVAIRMEPSYLIMADTTLEIPGLGEVTFDLAYGGNRYALLPARRVGLELTPAASGRICAVQQQMRRAINGWLADDGNQAPCPDILGVGFYEPIDIPLGFRFALVYGDGQLDRSPCGTATAARLATLHAKGAMRIGDELVHESLIGTVFRAKGLGYATVGDHWAVVPELVGSAFVLGSVECYLDPRDPLRLGFSLVAS